MKKLLIIEDDQPLRENISETLTLSGYEVICCPDGKSGVEKALKEKPDLILCDVIMPCLDGFGVLHILSRHPDTAAIPFIFLSGKKELSDLRKGMGLGADDYITKPFEDTELLESIELRLKKSKQKNVLANRPGLTDFFYHLTNAADGKRPDKWEVNKYIKKHIIYSADETPKAVYYVIAGKIKEYILHEEGKELIVNIYSRGDFIGYKEILEGTTYLGTLQVIEDAEMMVIPKAEFHELISTDPEVTKEIISLLCHEVREQEERLVDLAYNSLRKKVANAIIKVVDKFKDSREGKPCIEISREDLSHIIGSAPESMIRTLKEFKEEKLIEVSDGHIIVLNENKLRNLLY